MNPSLSAVCLLLVLSLHPLASAQTQPDLLIADFESADYGEWRASGSAFGPGPAAGTLPSQMEVSGFAGKRLVNSFYGGDGSTGKLVSPKFRIARKYMSFLIGGGGWPGKTCMNLIVEGQTVRTATGPNTQPGGSEALAPQSWEVGEFEGKAGHLEIIDDATGGWGHINVDQVVQTDQKPPSLLSAAKRELVLSKRYLNLPIKNGATKRRLAVLVENRRVRDVEIELADTNPDWWAFLDVSEFKGQRCVIEVDKLYENSAALKLIEQADTIRNSQTLYRESLRPQFHFTSRRGWNNDPNGLVFYKGEYHLFYQHNPVGWNWGNMHWGHAVSRDLVHWKELPIALYPDQHGTMFSGSAVVDWGNTGGFRIGGEKTLVAMFTAAGTPFTQGLAYSNDRGRTWSKYSGNPVLPHIVAENRDPKVIWYAPEKKWVMALYLDKNDFALFSSADLKSWSRLSDVKIAGASECPEFFEIAVDGDRKNKRWIFYGGNGRYLVGGFDGRNFTPESGPHELNFGNCFYASQTYNDIPESDGRRILIPWGQMSTPGMPFNQMMGLPVELTLRQTETGLRLHAKPVAELKSLRSKSSSLKPLTLAPGNNQIRRDAGELLEIIAELAPQNAAECGLIARGVKINYNAQSRELSCGPKKAVLSPIDGKLLLHVFVDRTSVDIFGNDGALYMPMGVIVPNADRSIIFYSRGADARLTSCKIYQLESAWK